MAVLEASRPVVVMPNNKLEKAVRIANKDGVGHGYCGRGVWTVLTGIGYGKGLKSGDGHDWETILRRAGWRSVPCVKPTRAPVGSVLVYNSDKRKYGRNKTGTKGGTYGHVELVALKSGSRVYVSDAPRNNPGGSVLKNFTGRAWLPPKKFVPRVSGAVASLGNSALPNKKLTIANSPEHVFDLGKLELHPKSWAEHEDLQSDIKRQSYKGVAVAALAGIRWPY